MTKYAPGVEERLRFYDHNEGKVLEALHSPGVSPSEHVAFVCDMRDPVARGLVLAIAEHQGKMGDLMLHGARMASQSQIQTGVFIFPRDVASQLMEPSSPQVARALQSPPPSGKTFVIIVAAGGSLLAAPALPS